ncbi:MAG TPA: acylase [Pyrinomonadaceae bacterium]
MKRLRLAFLFCFGVLLLPTAQRSYGQPVAAPALTINGAAASGAAGLTAGVSGTRQRPPRRRVRGADAAADGNNIARWERRAQNVTIIRDDWGIPHVYGRTDADAVFGLLYAQAEDDFNRVEMNYLNALGRTAEAEGERAVYQDLRMRLFTDPDSLRAQYATSPAWLKALMDAMADGLNYYLYKHPEVKPKVITRFEPWMALSFTEGSIGWDIETIDLKQLEAFYGRGQSAQEPPGAGPGAADTREFQSEPGGSNGIAVAPANTVNRRALLLINPHTSFFFRAEVQAVSAQGLNVYGAVTWGQFFVYQGFNDRVGWMHTSSQADALDEYVETVVKRDDRLYYRYGRGERPLTVTRLSLPYRTAGGMGHKEFTVYRTHHGPVVREADGKWVSVRLMHEPVKALTQSYLRTKARNYKEFRRTMELHTNSSNNTIYADADGHIAYFHANFIPRRDPRFDWTKPVDGSDPATEWRGLLSVEESPHLLDPPNGWLYNSNDWPWGAAGPYSPRRENYPRYVDNGGPSPRGRHAVRVLHDKKDFTLESLRRAAYDSYLTAFDELLPPLFKAYDEAPTGHPLKAKLAEQIGLLRAWDRRWSVASVPTSLAVFWATELARHGANPTAAERLAALGAATDRLARDFGNWKTPWGEINRFQRLTGDIVQPFDDAAPSTPVGFTAGRWGSLASFTGPPHQGAKRWYGTSGNSFVAVVEFGDRVRARAITAGGESGHPGSPHFNDQAERYAAGDLREVYFYRAQLKGHTERIYHPGR